MNDHARFWADPRLVYTVAAAAVALLLITIWLFRRRRKEGRQAAVVCLMLSIALHLALIVLVPMVTSPPGGSTTVNEQSEQDAGVESVEFATFDPDMQFESTASDAQTSMVAPLPVANLTDVLESKPEVTPEIEQQAPIEEPIDDLASEEFSESTTVAESLEDWTQQSESLNVETMAEIDSQLSDLLDAAFAAESPSAVPASQADPSSAAVAALVTPPSTMQQTPAAPQATVPGSLESDFANRTGDAKLQALVLTGGSEQTEAAVEAALRFLVSSQRADGSWGSRASGGGIERRPLGITRTGAGSRADTAITGLALLTLMGAGHTHQSGEYADNVFRGLAFLIRQQAPSGSLAGNATVAASTYCHGMASLAMCEAAAITRDANAIACSRRAIAYTQRLQHPTTGGWRYTPGDPGDLSQLGWQAMVLDAGHRAGIAIDGRSVKGVQRFLRRVRMGTHGGLAAYRPGEAPSRTMTAEALATRLLIGDGVTDNEIIEAERYLLQKVPGIGQDNYYYWYYATLALHQLQDDAWQQWNQALKQRLTSTQLSDGSWAADTVWGGYGGKIYTTSMATLCLETYYRHAVRNSQQRIAERPQSMR
ncbi:MAG: prenyltransferase/squalene oxidase repeat-containing protein [Planctomycetota bacterium]